MNLFISKSACKGLTLQEIYCSNDIGVRDECSRAVNEKANRNQTKSLERVEVKKLQ